MIGATLAMLARSIFCQQSNAPIKVINSVPAPDHTAYAMLGGMFFNVRLRK